MTSHFTGKSKRGTFIMHLSIKLILSGLVASLLLAVAVTTASATRLSVSNQNIRATWTSLEKVAEGVTTIRCQMTLEGSFHTRTIAKVSRSLIGAITKAAVKQETCTNGSVSVFNGVDRYNGTTTPNTLPWHLTYDSFTGTLPSITAVNLLFSRYRFGLTVAGLCTGQYGSATDNIVLAATRDASGAITGLSPRAGANFLTLIRRDAGLACPEREAISGTGSLTLLGTTTRITITLI
jgi:hypothetical protein